jgi:HEAT repeat protein
VATGLGTVGDPYSVPALTTLTADPDVLVRAAAFEAAGQLGCPPPLDDAAARTLNDMAWEVRKGAAQALGAAPGDLGVEALTTATGDPHPDVRKAAVGALARWAAEPAVSVALKSALDDSDADVRALARQAIST